MRNESPVQVRINFIVRIQLQKIRLSGMTPGVWTVNW